MKFSTLFIVLGISFFALLCPVPSFAAVFSDNFDDNSINASRWNAFSVGTGPTVQETNGRIELTFPSTSADDPGKGIFGAGVGSQCKFRGDFDVEVDYQLPAWPSGSGVRSGVTIGFNNINLNFHALVERTSFGTQDVGAQGQEVYLMDLRGNVQGITSTNHTAGKFKAVRLGDNVQGYYWSPETNAWIQISNGLITTGDVDIDLAAWSHNWAFTDQPAQATFDNFIVNTGQMICPEPTPTPTPQVALFKQNDPRWGDQIYASANKQHLDCGDTIAECGCALTSAAMVLNHHGANKSPLNGSPTTPETLNDYLRQGEKCALNGCTSKGYSFGSLLWPVAGVYSADANRRFGTQKVEYIGGSDYNSDTVTDDILANNPVILKVLRSSHWATAVSILANTFGLNDPAHNATKLSDAPYNNNAFSMRRYEKTSSDFSFFEVASLAPTQILLIDSQGRRTGFDEETNSVLKEIPNSYYYFEEAVDDDTGQNPPPPANAGIYIAGIKYPQQDSYDVRVIGDSGNLYSFTTHGSDREGGLLFDIFEATPSGSLHHEYSFNYNPEPEVQTLSMQVPIDIKPGSDENPINCKERDGVIPVAIISTETFNALDIDADSVRFEDAKETHIDKKTGRVKRHEEDVNGDGQTDLVFHFKFSDTDLACDSLEGKLVGKNKDDLIIEGRDVIN